MKTNQFYISKLVLLSLLALILLSASSCSSSKRIRKGKKKGKHKITAVERKLIENQHAPEWFKAKTKIKYKDPNFQQGFAADIRMKKDSVIWLCAYPAMIKIPVAYAVITPEKIQIIDKINKKYYNKDIEYIETLIGYPIDFATMQNMILGNIPIETTEKMEVASSQDGHQLSSSENDIQFSVMLEPKDYTIRNMEIKDTGNRQIDIQQTDYQALNDKPFSHKRLITISIPELYKADLNFSKVETPNSSIKMPFPIKKSYEVVE